MRSRGQALPPSRSSHRPCLTLSNASPRSRATTTCCSATFGASCTMASRLSREPATRSLRFRAERGTVILITNAPRPAVGGAILDRLGVPRDAYDAIVSSATSPAASLPGGCRKAFFISVRRAICSIFAGLDVAFAPLETADYVVCSGLFDDTVGDTGQTIASCSRRCAGGACSWSAPIPTSLSSGATRCVYCAGALADAYAALGGEVLYCGKPYAPIYDAGARPKLRPCAAAQRRSSACWRSAIRFGPI